MRILTKLEQRGFESAYNFIDRVCIAGNETQDIYIIKVLNDGKSHSIPSKVIELIYKKGGLLEAGKHFNGHAKEKILPKFIKMITDNREQPREYFSSGTLVIEDIEVQVMSYSD